MTSTNFPEGELCLDAVDSRCQALVSDADKTTATDTARVMSSARYIAAELRRIRTARRAGAYRAARRHVDRLIDYVWFSDPDAA